MTSDGDTKEDVKLPDGEIGQKITKLFTEEGKDTRKLSIERILLQPRANMKF